jgi:hypothetical protein
MITHILLFGGGLATGIGGTVLFVIWLGSLCDDGSVHPPLVSPPQSCPKALLRPSDLEPSLHASRPEHWRARAPRQPGS